MALGLMGTAAAAHAELSGTIGLVSDYDFRGISLSAKDPALQGSIDWAGDSGFYVGAWASNIDYGRDVDGDIELDLYAGFAGGDEDGLGWDLGIVWYTSPGASGTDLDGWYTEGNGSFGLPLNFSLNLHLGYNYGDAFEDTEYFDYSIGVGYSFANFDFELKWVDNDLSSSDFLYTKDDVFNSEGRAIFSVSTTFPW